jgi:RHS repeat-associated protein
MLSSISSHFALAKNSPSYQCLRLTRMMRRCLAILLLASMLTLSVPVSVAALVMREGMRRSTDLATRANATFASWVGSINSQDRGQSRGMPPSPMNPRGVKPPPPLSKEDSEARAASIQINPSGSVVLQSRQPMLFSAIPVDSQGVTIHGLQAEWESSNRQIVFVTKNGQAVAGKPGTAILTAKAGSARESVRVTVIEGTREKFGGKKKENSRRPRRQAGRSTPAAPITNVARTFGNKKQHVSSFGRPSGKKLLNTRAPGALLPLRDPNEDPLPDDETGSLYQPANSVGAPPGKTRPGGLTPSVAAEGTETGNKNFTFGLPIVNLPGRGIDVSLNLTYNSLLYNKSTDPFDSSTWLTYDVDSGYPAPGFRLGYGQIEDQGGFGFTLTDADGTRHALSYTSPNNYDSNDGTFIHFTGGRGWGTLFYSDGTRVFYGAAGGGQRSYPTQITDRNGNYILISYEGGIGPRINSIKDTLGRYVRFYYASNGDLTSITAPGLTGQSDREVMRFFYQDISFNASSLFSSTVNVTMPSSSHVIKYIFLSNSVETNNAHIGYRFDYSDYGMVYQTVQFRGMVLNSGSTAVSNEGTQAAISTYNYPGTPVNSTTGLSDIPTYTTRTDDWAGRITGMNGNPAAAPYHTFSVDESTGVSIVTAPDGAVTETHAIVSPGQWNDGLISETFLDKQGSGALSHTVIDWEQGAGGTPRVSQVRTTNETGQTKGTVLSYTASYNNVTAVSERDFTTDGSVSATELRRTVTTYVTSSSYTNRYLIHLPETVKVFPGGSATPISRVDYAYDNYGTNHANLTGRPGIIMHEPAFDPFQETQESCDWVCYEYDPWWVNCINWQWVCNYYNPYDPATDYRGNVTSVTTYPDTSNTSTAITHATTYDIAGNVITTQVNCCQLKTFSYTDNPDTHTYAYPTSETRGDPNGLHLTTSVTYDFNTGLVGTVTDENGQVSTNFYHGDSLRLEHVVSPDGGAAYLTYSEALEADANGKNHYYVQTQTKLDAPGGSPRYVTSRRYFDGRDAVARSFDNFTSTDGYSTQDVEYDVMGRAYRTSNPYFSGGYSSTINPEGFWTNSTFDHMGRVTQITMPRGDDNNSMTTSAQASYEGVFTTVTDQAGKQRRQKVDALGRVVRLDEPDSSGNLGATGSPNQATSYDYDTLDNLVHIAQPGPNSITQHRYFKFDSLSRLIRERQVEQATNANYALSDALTGNSAWSRKIEYNSDSLVTDGYDARGVHTHFVYDGLNRLTQITYSDATPAAHYFYDSQSLPNDHPNYTLANSNGRLIAMTYGSGATGNYFNYDVAGRVVSQWQVTGSTTYSMNYSYNLAGMLTSQTYPSGRALSHAYDEGGRLTSIGDGTTTFANSFSYEAHGGLKSETWGNGAVHSRNYNRRLQPSEVKLKQSATGSELQRFNYSYGQVTQATGAIDTNKNNGQIGRIDGFMNGAATKEWDQRFVYDELGRLSIAAEYQQGNNSNKTWQVQYGYDRWGNRFQSGSGNSGVNYTSVLASEIDSATNHFIASGSTPTTYDAAGNITTDTKFRGLNYDYDANGRQSVVKLLDNTSIQSSVYDCAGQRVQTTDGSKTRTMVYDVFGHDVADYLGSSGTTLERENIYRGGQLLATFETGAASAPTGLAATAASGSITLNWSAASGTGNYRVERKGAGGAYGFLSATSSTNFTDSGASLGSAYLYRVCAADGTNNCTSGYSNIVLGARLNFPTDPSITTMGDDPSGQTVTKMKAAHITELRSAVNAVRSLAGLPAATWAHPTLTPSVTEISKNDVNELRTKLDEALTALGVRTSNWIDHPLAGAPNGTLIRGVQITQLRQCATNGSSCYKPIAQFVKDFYQGAFHRQPTAGELSTWTATLGQAQAQGSGQLLAAAQSLGTTLFNSAEYANLSTSNAQFVTDLYTGYLQRTHDLSGYNFWLGILNSENDRAHLIQAFAVSPEFGNNVSALCAASATSGGLRYVLSDVQGSSRAMMNNGTYGSSAIIARHDYLPFGEEIGSGVGLRTGIQGYGASDTNRRKYGLTERDDATGLDHTWWRKYENASGRWTTPDPLGGSIADPQSFNRYSYVQNDPVNLIDPFGLFCVDYERWDERTATLYVWSECYLEGGGGGGGSTLPGGGGGRGGDTGGGGGGGGGGTGTGSPTGLATGASNRSRQNFQERLKKCVSDIYGVQLTSFTGAKAGSLGTFSGTGYNRHTGRTGNIVVMTNASGFSSQQLATMSDSYARSYPQRGHPTVQPGERVLGATFSFGMAGFIQVSPYVNYLANNIPFEKFNTTPDVVREFLQVHELGHSLADITGKGKGERGKQLEDCVFGTGQRK